MISYRLTMIPCDDSTSIELNRIASYSIKVTLNRLTMMLCDDSASIESNRIDRIDSIKVYCID